MINELKIDNFQSHKKTKLHFHKGVNVIVGESDSGKSAIIRALQYVIYNRPTGDAFCSHWGGVTSVKAIINDKEIQRIKTKSKNEYKLTGFDEPFTAFGNKVPDEIKNLFNMDEVNIQQQMDSIFLISDTPGSVAQYFNKVANIDKIDTTLSNITKEINSINSEIKHRQKEIEIKQKQLDDFIDIEAAEKQLSTIERKENKLKETTKSIKELSQLINKIKGTQQERTELAKEIQSESDIDEVLSLYNELNTIKSKKSKLKELIYIITDVSKASAQLPNVLRAEKEINKTLRLFKQHKNINIEKGWLQSSIDLLDRTIKRRTSKEKQLKQLENNYKKEFPNECPLCGTKIK